MKRFILPAVIISVIVITAMSVIPTIAAKPVDQDGIPIGNGFPSGPHYNLNIHGKKADFNCSSIEPDLDGYYGNSVFIPEVVEKGDLKIYYVQNKKSSISELKVIDPCGFNDTYYNDGVDDVKVQLPYEAKGYYVYARILAKPNNSQKTTDGASTIILYPTEIVEACNDVDPEATECDDLINIGLIVGNNLYTPDFESATYERFDPNATKAKGKSKATEITTFFTYTGWAVDNTLDINSGDGVTCGAGTRDVPLPDGKLNDCDVPIDADTIVTYYNGLTGSPTGSVNYYDHYDDPNYDENDGDQSGSVDRIQEWLLFQQDLYNWSLTATFPATHDYSDYYPVYCLFFDEEFILNIAELVIAGQDIYNDGTKLLQIRFYPCNSTTFDKVK